MHNFAAKYSLFDFCKIKLNKKMAPVKFHLPVLLMFLPPEIVSPPFLCIQVLWGSLIFTSSRAALCHHCLE